MGAHFFIIVRARRAARDGHGPNFPVAHTNQNFINKQWLAYANTCILKLSTERRYLQWYARPHRS